MTAPFKSIAAISLSLLAGQLIVTAQVLNFDNSEFQNWSTITAGAEYLGDVMVGGTKVAEARLEFDNYNLTGVLAPSQTLVTTSESFRIGTASNPAGLDPASSVDFTFTIESITPGWTLDGLSLTTNQSTLAIDSISLSYDGPSATIEDTEPVVGMAVVDLIAGVGVAPQAFTSGSTIDFIEANHDASHDNGFLNATHSQNWGVNMAGSSTFNGTYTTIDYANNIANEFVEFGAQFTATAVPEPSTGLFCTLLTASMIILRRGRS